MKTTVSTHFPNSATGKKWRRLYYWYWRDKWHCNLNPQTYYCSTSWFRNRILTVFSDSYLKYVDLSDLLQTIVIYRKLPTFDTEKALNEGNGAEPCQALLNLWILSADQIENNAPIAQHEHKFRIWDWNRFKWRQWCWTMSNLS